MRDAMGGTVVLVIIVVFIVIALGYMAFNVNYTKAFRMRNKIVSVYNAYDGECLSDCQTEIQKYASSIGYSIGNGALNCPDSSYSVDGNKLYCYKAVDITHKTNEDSYDIEGVYYKIVTKIDVKVPIINNALNLRVLYITGDTKTFKRAFE